MSHAVLSPSGAKRWLTCTPSARLEQRFADSAGDAAKEGTLAHAIAEISLQQYLGIINKLQYTAQLRKLQNAPEFKGSDGKHLYQPEMLEHVKEYTGYVIEKFNEAKAIDPLAEIYLETKVDVSEYVPEGYGTVDVRIVFAGIQHIIDLKYGKGVLVAAEENTQMMIYSLGGLRDSDMFHDIHTCRMTIHQVRLGDVGEWQIGKEELLDWAVGYLRPRAAQAFAGEGDYVAGDHCRFCRAKGPCRANAEFNLGPVEHHNYNDPALLNADELARIYLVKDTFTKWLTGVEEYMQAQAQQGAKFPGLKLVEGRSNRVFTDAEKVAEALRGGGYPDKDIYKPQELIALGAVEKMVGKVKFPTLLAGLYIKPTGKPTLVPAADKRPELGSADSALADFEGIEI